MTVAKSGFSLSHSPSSIVAPHKGQYADALSKGRQV